MSKEGSVAPKERINITFTPDTDGTVEEKELPLKMMVVGDFTGREDSQSIEDRKTVNINKDNFDEVLSKQDVNIQMSIPNKLDETSEDLSISLKIDSIKNFDPESIVNQVPELQKLMELRDALVALKGPLGNVPAFRKAIENALEDSDSRDRVLKELDLDS